MNVTGLSSSKKAYLKGFYLEQNNPNPFNASTTIKFVLHERDEVLLKIYNLLGYLTDFGMFLLI